MQSASITAKAEPAVSSHVGRQQCFRIYKQKRFLWIMAHRLFNKGSLQRQYLVLLTTKGRQRIPMIPSFLWNAVWSGFPASPWCQGCHVAVHLLGRKSPADIWWLIFDDKIISSLVKQTNLYDHRVKNCPDFCITAADLLKFYGIILPAGYNTLPDEAHYWSNQLVNICSSASSCGRSLCWSTGSRTPRLRAGFCGSYSAWLQWNWISATLSSCSAFRTV